MDDTEEEEEEEMEEKAAVPALTPHCGSAELKRLLTIAQQLHRIYIYLMVSLFGVFGVIVRIYLDIAWLDIGFAKGSAYPSVFIPTNIIGSIVMGIMVATKDSIFEKYASRSPQHASLSFAHFVIHRLPVLGVALSSGFCGSLTTFSSWMVAAAGALVEPDVSDCPRVVLLLTIRL